MGALRAERCWLCEVGSSPEPGWKLGGGEPMPLLVASGEVWHLGIAGYEVLRRFRARWEPGEDF